MQQRCSWGVQERIDWLSRPVSDIPQVFANRPVGVIGATPGGFWHDTGARRLDVGPAHASHVPMVRVMVSHAAKVFNEAGELVDETVRGQLRDYLRGFVRFIQAASQ